MIRMAHFADIHIGMENYGKFDPETGVNSRVRDFLHRMDEMVDYAIQNRVELAIFAGDAFKNAQPNLTLQREFAGRILDLAAQCPVVLLLGNHDMPPNPIRAHSIELFDTFRVAGVTVADHYELYDIQTAAGGVYVGTAPYPAGARLLSTDQLQGKSPSEIDQAISSQMLTLLRYLRDSANTAANPSAPRVLTGHFTVAGAATGIEKTLMLGRDLEVPLSELDDPAWDYVALGHIHKHQNLTHNRPGSPPVVYSGSLEAIDFGEEGEPKGFCWVELERGQTTWHFNRVNSRPFITLRIDVRGLEEPTDDVMMVINAHDGLGGAVVRVLIQADIGHTIDEKAIRARLMALGVSYCRVEFETARAARSRLGDNPELLTDLDLLARYWADKDKTPAQIERLLEKAQAILDEVNQVDGA
jgi:exonuclease SbcD